MNSSDHVTIGLSESGHYALQRLKEDGVFAQMMDGYRFAIALAIKEDLTLPDSLTNAQTIFNVGSLDKNGDIKNLVTVLCPECKDAPYAYAERLAEAGTQEMIRLYDSGQLRFSQLFETEIDNNY